MKWKPLKPDIQTVQFLETPIGTFFITTVNENFHFVITPHGYPDEEHSTVAAAKSWVERYINGLAAELSEGIWE